MQTTSTLVNVLEQKKILLKLCVIFQIFLKLFYKAAIKKIIKSYSLPEVRMSNNCSYLLK